MRNNRSTCTKNRSKVHGQLGNPTRKRGADSNPPRTVPFICNPNNVADPRVARARSLVIPWALHWFIPGDCYLHARLKVNYHWRKARWHASNAPGVTPSCLPTSFDLAPLALVSGRGGENALGSRKSIGISSLACCEMWVKMRRDAHATCEDPYRRNTPFAPQGMPPASNWLAANGCRFFFCQLLLG
jgi:hypothetical protein